MNTKVFTPKESKTVLRIEQTSKDRAEFKRQWQEDRDYKEKIKSERFAAIKERRRNSKLDGSGGINIEINR